MKYIHKLIKIIKPYCTWRFLVCYIPVYFVAAGWAYICSVFAHGWLRTIAIAWLAFLYMPFCPEKLVTIPITIWLHKKLFPKHTTKVIEDLILKEKSLDKRSK